MPRTSSAGPKSSTAAPLYRKLRPRPNGPAHVDIVANQRARVHGAMIEAAVADGYASTSVAALCRLAGISKRTFYEQFPNKEACLLDTYEQVLDGTTAAMVAAQRAAPSDPQLGLRAALSELLRLASDHPNAARLALVEAPHVGLAAQALETRARLRVEQMVAECFERTAASPPPLLIKGIVCGIEQVLCHALERVGDPISRNHDTVAQQLGDWVLAYAQPALTRLPRHASAPVRQAPRASAIGPRASSDRARILRAAGEIVANDGYARLTPAQIVHRSGIAEETFWSYYGDVERCFLDTLDLLWAEALMSAADASRAAGDGVHGVCAAIAALLERVAADRVLRRVTFLEARCAGPIAMQRQERLRERSAGLLAKRVQHAARPRRVAAEATIGAVWGVIEAHAKHETAHLLPSLLPQIAYLALTPLAGAEATVEALSAEAASLVC